MRGQHEGNLNVFLEVAQDLEVNGLVLEVPRHEGVSHVQQSPFPKTKVQSATSKFLSTVQSSSPHRCCRNFLPLETTQARLCLSKWKQGKVLWSPAQPLSWKRSSRKMRNMGNELKRACRLKICTGTRSKSQREIKRTSENSCVHSVAR